MARNRLFQTRKHQIKKEELGLNEWMTPPWLLEKIYKIFPSGFDIDVASPVGIDTAVKASHCFTHVENGLEQSWDGFPIIWCNPPYNDIESFVRKAFLEMEITTDTDKMILMLIPSFIDFNYWHDLIFPKSSIIFFRGRITFRNPDETRRHQYHANALVILDSGTDWCREKRNQLRDEFSEHSFISAG
jgi:phage N-6-adenine-methyltransferase